MIIVGTSQFHQPTCCFSSEAGNLSGFELTRCKEQPPVDGDQVVLGQLLGGALCHGGRVVEPRKHWQGGAHDVQPGKSMTMTSRTVVMNSFEVEDEFLILPGKH